MSKNKIEIYTITRCPYCDRAKQLLTKKGQTWEEINLDNQENRWEESIKRSGGRQTVPQIYINGTHVGGSDDLYALDKAGNLDPMLGL